MCVYQRGDWLGVKIVGMKASLNWVNTYLNEEVTLSQAVDALTDAGFPVEEWDELTEAGQVPDVRMDVEITSNRGDVMSHVGVARELAVATGQRLKMPTFEKTVTLDKATDFAFSVKNDAAKDCGHYVGRVLENVQVGESPAWLKTALENAGLRCVNNVVDVTNYVCLALGQPMHAFDADKLAGAEVQVRLSKKGEKFKAIDGSEHELSDGLLVIAPTRALGKQITLAI